MKLISLLLVAAMLCFLCVTNPTTEEFSVWYAQQTIGSADGAMDQLAQTFTQYLAQQAERSDYLICSVFSYNGHMTLGAGLMFFPIDSLSEQVGILRADYAAWLEENGADFGYGG